MNEVFSIFLDNRAEAQTAGPHGYWLSLPTTAEQVQEALKEIHMLAVFVLLPLKSVLTPRKYPQNPGLF